jgi:hypothetical protein
LVRVVRCMRSQRCARTYLHRPACPRCAELQGITHTCRATCDARRATRDMRHAAQSMRGRATSREGGWVERCGCT